MFLEGLDVIGLTLTLQEQIDAFSTSHWESFPWMRDVARVTRRRLQAEDR